MPGQATSLWELWGLSTHKAQGRPMVKTGGRRAPDPLLQLEDAGTRTCTLQLLRVPGQVRKGLHFADCSVNSHLVSFVGPQNPSPKETKVNSIPWPTGKG